MKRFRGGIVFKTHRLLYHSPLGSRVVKSRRHSHERLLIADRLLPLPAKIDDLIAQNILVDSVL